MDPATETVADLQKQIEKYRGLLEAQEKSLQILIRRDLELSRANERLQELDQMKTDFVSVATHQLRTPLAAIKWTLSMLLKGDLGPLNTEQRTFLMKSHENNNRMIALLGDMLLSDQIESGKLKVLNTDTHLPDLIDNMLLEIRPLGTKRDVGIIFPQSGSTMAPVHIDSQQMRAIIQNLLENAVKYSKPSGVVKINVEEQADHVLMTVEDSGIGIPVDEQGKIFSRFFRAPNAISVETDGSGLGLFIVKSIVEKNHGAISFTSVEDQGTTFRVELPVSRPVV
jgi:signal transduction histidine kinase